MFLCGLHLYYIPLTKSIKLENVCIEPAVIQVTLYVGTTMIIIVVLQVYQAQFLNTKSDKNVVTAGFVKEGFYPLVGYSTNLEDIFHLNVFNKPTMYILLIDPGVQPTVT